MHRSISRLWVFAAVAAGVLSVHSVRADDLNWAQKMFSELKIDFGTVARGSDVRRQLIVENLYKETVTLSHVGTTCGCSAATPDKTVLGTHEKAVIEVVMNTTKFMRRKDSNVDVTLSFDGVNFKTVRVPITAYIRPDVVLTPGDASFTNVYFGEPSTRTIDIAYAGRDDWKIREVRGGNDLISTELKEVSRGAGRVEYQLAVTLKPDAPVGSFRDQLVLVTDDPASPEVPVLVQGQVKPDIVVTPETVKFAELQPGTERTVNVVIKGNKKFAIGEIVAESDRECFKTKFSKEEKNVHILPLTIKAPMEPGDLHEVFTITIDGRPTPITFKAEGTVRGG